MQGDQRRDGDLLDDDLPDGDFLPSTMNPRPDPASRATAVPSAGKKLSSPENRLCDRLIICHTIDRLTEANLPTTLFSAREE